MNQNIPAGAASKHESNVKQEFEVKTEGGAKVEDENGGGSKIKQEDHPANPRKRKRVEAVESAGQESQGHDSEGSEKFFDALE